MSTPDTNPELRPTEAAVSPTGMHMDEHVDPNQLEIAAGREREQLEGWAPTLSSDAEIFEAFEKAFDYRGDVTLTLTDGTAISGYIFDRRIGASLEDSAVRIIPAKERTKITVPYKDIASVAFTGRDTAAGKSFDAWVKKYHEKKVAGETDIAIMPENLD